MSNDRKIIKKALDTNDFYETTVKIINGSLQNVEIELGGEYDVNVQVSGLIAGKIELRTKSVDFTGDDNTYDILETSTGNGTASYTGGNSYLQIRGNGLETGTAFNLRLQVKKK